MSKVLEIGSGEEAVMRPENVHLDTRGLPGITYVQDATDLSNIKEKFDKVTSKHCLEHISWRLVPQTLKEWRRVLVKGGVLEIEVPSALHAARILLGDTERKLDGEPDFEFFNRITFGHQDYAANYHCCLFTSGMLVELLKQAGFRNISVLFDDEFIKVEAVK